MNWPQSHCEAGKKKIQRKIPMTPSEIEPAIYRLVAQCLNQTRHRIPQESDKHFLFSWLYGVRVTDQLKLEM
jgi:hypothetical protein